LLGNFASLTYNTLGKTMFCNSTHSYTMHGCLCNALWKKYAQHSKHFKSHVLHGKLEMSCEPENERENTGKIAKLPSTLSATLSASTVVTRTGPSLTMGFGVIYKLVISME
jgi:hypothetical protein